MMRCAVTLALALTAGLAGCKGGETTPAGRAEVRLVRSPNGRIAVELLHAPEDLRALQAELVVEGSATFALEDVQAPSGLPLDSIRLEMRGTNRAILFAGDKRGVRLPRSGPVATFVARPNASSSGSSQLRIAGAVVSTNGGDAAGVVLGAAISVR